MLGRVRYTLQLLRLGSVYPRSGIPRRYRRRLLHRTGYLRRTLTALVLLSAGERTVSVRLTLCLLLAAERTEPACGGVVLLGRNAANVVKNFNICELRNQWPMDDFLLEAPVVVNS